MSLFSANISVIAAGDSNSIAITSTGQTYIWGSNFWVCKKKNLQMNILIFPKKKRVVSDSISNGDALLPILFTGLSNFIITRAAIGKSHVLALTSSGVVYTWGNNDFGLF